MYELVELKNDDVFTNSKVIAEGTNNKHHAVQQLIQKYEEVFIREFGAVAFEMRVLKHKNAKGSTQEKVYLLNEGQAMFLMTLLRNDGVNGIVVRFKARLSKEFMRMKNFIREKQSKLWNDTRIANKENRLKETDVIKLLVDYAKEQGSTHSDKLYVTYTKLAKAVIAGNRNELTASELNNLTLVENIILQTIRIDMSMGMHYKDIYKDCKDKIEQFINITYLAG